MMKTAQSASPRQWIGIAMVYFSIPLTLLASGGDFGWWQAWVYSLLIVVAGLDHRHGWSPVFPAWLTLPGIVLDLGSVWTLVPAALALVIAVLRTALEDRTLQQEPPGYADYARQVRYRLMPGVY